MDGISLKRMIAGGLATCEAHVLHQIQTDLMVNWILEVTTWLKQQDALNNDGDGDLN